MNPITPADAMLDLFTLDKVEELLGMLLVNVEEASKEEQFQVIPQYTEGTASGLSSAMIVVQGLKAIAKMGTPVEQVAQTSTDVLAHAMACSVLFAFLLANKDNPGITMEYIMGSMNSLYEATPVELNILVDNYINSPEGVDWRMSMGIAPWAGEEDADGPDN